MANSTTATDQGRRYPGVQSFADEEVHRRLFYGRGDEIYDLLHLVLAERLVVLFARSGIGKTSIINAGLMQPLRDRGLFPIVVRVTGVAGDPLDSFYRGVKAACDQGVRRGEIDAYEPGDVNDWNRTSLWHFIKTFYLWRDDKLLQPVIIIDQFEELFTLISGERRKGFIDELSSLVRGRRPELASQQRADEPELSDRPPEVKVVLSIREDFMANLEELAEKIPAILKSRFRLGPLVPEQARLAIVEPSRLDAPGLETPRFSWSPDLLELTLDFLCRRKAAGGGTEAGNEVEPFQLQLVCQYVEDLVRAEKLESVSVKDLGGEDALGRILARFYENSINHLCRRFPRFGIRGRLKKLCEQGLITSKGRRLLREESTINESNHISSDILAAMVELRLIRKEPRVGDNYYELSHDTLIAPILASRQRRERKNLIVTGIAAGLLVIGVSLFVYETRDQLFETRSQLEDRTMELTQKQTELEAVREAIRLAETAESIMDDDATGASLTESALLATASLQRTQTLPGYLAWVNAMKLLPASSKPILDHPGKVSSAVFDAGGARLAVADNDGMVRLWEIPSGTEPLLSLDHEHAVSALVLSADGIRLATARASTAQLWDTNSGDNIVLPEHGGFIGAMALSADGAFLATASQTEKVGDGNPETSTVQVWDAKSGEKIAGLDLEDVINQMVFTDNARLWIASGNGTLELWDVMTGEKAATLNLEGPINALALSADGARLVTTGRTGGYDKRPETTLMQVWDGGTGRNIARLDQEDSVSALALDAGGTRLVTVSEDGLTVRLWDTRDGAEYTRLPIDRDEDSVVAVVFESDGPQLATLSVNGNLRLWDTRSDAESASLDPGDSGYFFVFSTDGTHFVTAGEDGLRLWNAQSGEAIHLEHDGFVIAVSLSADGTRVATATEDGAVRLWDGTNGENMTLDRDGPVAAMVLSADGTRLATASEDGAVQLWDAGSGERTVRLDHEGFINTLLFSADGARLVTDSHKREGGDAVDSETEARMVQLWDAKSGKKTGDVKHGGFVNPLLLSADGTRLAGGGEDGTIQMWDAENGERTGLLEHAGFVSDMVFSPDGTRLATVAEDGTVQLWDTRGGKRPLGLAHEGFVSYMVFNASGTHLAMVSGSTAQLFDTQSGTKLLQLEHPDVLTAVVFSGDDQHLITASETGTVRSWLWKVDALIAQGCRRLNRNFTRSEWDRYFPKESYRKICANLPEPAESTPQAVE